MSARRFRAKWLSFVLMLPLVPTAADPPAPAGHWEGAIQLPGTELKIDIDLRVKDGAWEGDITIPAQGAKDLALGDVKVEGTKITFKLPNIPGDPAFSGTLSDDKKTLSGDFAQSGHTTTFSLSQQTSKAPKAKERLADFDAFVEQARQDWNVPGFAIAVVVDGETVYAKGFGLSDVENKKPVTPKTLFPIGSCTKAFTTFVMGTLVDEGKLDWDKPVREYLPGFKLYDEYATMHLTPRDMVSHRSGLPRHDLVWYNNQTLNRAQIVERLRHLPPSKELREAFQYNNLMFISAGHLVETLTGGTWEEATTARVLKPLGMTRTNLSVNASQKTSDYALPYEEKDDVIKRMDFRNIDTAGPAGSINSNLEDMAKWVLVNVNDGKIGEKKIIDATTLAETHKPAIVANEFAERFEMSVAAYGLGWMVDDYRGHPRVHHGGAIDGFTAWVAVFPKDGVGMVAFANKNGASLPWRMINHAADRVFDLEKKDWNGEGLAKRKIAKEEEKKAKEKKQTVRKQGTKPSHELSEYAGEFEHPGYGIAKFELDPKAEGGPRLVFHCTGIVTPLEHWHYDVFNGLENPKDTTFEDLKFRFVMNTNGDVDAVAIPMEPAVDETVFKRKPDAKLTDPKYLDAFTGVYSLSGQDVTISLKGAALTAYVPGQPVYDLIPARNDEFTLKGLTGFSVKFGKSADGAMSATFNQPNGVFEAKKKS